MRCGYDIGSSVNGRFSEETTLAEIFDAFDSHEPLTTQEEADKVDIPKRTAFDKLVKLADQHMINRKDIGQLATFWYKSE